MNTSTPAAKNALTQLFTGFWSLISWMRIILTNLVFLLVLIIVLAAIFGSSLRPLPEQFALRLAPTGVLVDQRSHLDASALLLGGQNPEDNETLVRELVVALDEAAKDPRVTGLVMELDGLMGGGLSKMQEVGAALDRFRASGKPAIAVGGNFSQDQYYLASHADEIYLHDMGGLLLTGYGRYSQYYKSALDKLAVNFHVFRTGNFKDAVEPFLRDDMSEESKAHNSRLIHELWDSYTTQVEKRRQLPPGSINDYIDQLETRLAAAKGDAAWLAAELGLVDDVGSRQKFDQQLVERFGQSDEGYFYQGVGVRAYLANLRLKQKENATDKIGLIVASGTILDGYQPDGSIGSNTLVDLLRSLHDQEHIKALVIRIDSGGGSAFASEVIRAEIAALRARGIPVLVSMGSVAASGGYWIAAGADEIWATPTSITGSIGVFGAFPTLEASLAKLGIHTDGVGTTELSGALRSDRPLSPKAGEIIQQSVDHIYRRFIRLVADARKTEPEAIDQVAQGQIWSGAKAKTLGLVDHLGNLEDVIAAAAQRAQLENYAVEVIRQPLSPGEEFLRQLMSSQVGALLSAQLTREGLPLTSWQEIKPLLRPLTDLQKMNDPRAIYAWCADCLAP